MTKILDLFPLPAIKRTTTIPTTSFKHNCFNYTNLERSYTCITKPSSSSEIRNAISFSQFLRKKGAVTSLVKLQIKKQAKLMQGKLSKYAETIVQIGKKCWPKLEWASKRGVVHMNYTTFFPAPNKSQKS